MIDPILTLLAEYDRKTERRLSVLAEVWNNTAELLAADRQRLLMAIKGLLPPQPTNGKPVDRAQLAKDMQDQLEKTEG